MKYFTQTTRPHSSVPVGTKDETLDKKIAAAHAHLFQTRNVAYMQMHTPVQKLSQSR